jgi:hypothetical protein
VRVLVQYLLLTPRLELSEIDADTGKLAVSLTWLQRCWRVLGKVLSPGYREFNREILALPRAGTPATGNLSLVSKAELPNINNMNEQFSGSVKSLMYM